jgi:hypothetical protein
MMILIWSQSKRKEWIQNIRDIYRAPNEDMLGIERLAACILPKRSMIGGDLNLPQAEWKGDVEKASGFRAVVNNLVWDNGYTQVVSGPTKLWAQRRLVARICALLKAYTGGRAWKAIRDRLLKPSYLSKDDHNRKIRTTKQTDVAKYSFLNRTIRSWNQLPAGLQASFPCKINTFRKRVKNVVTSKGIKAGSECK